MIVGCRHCHAPYWRYRRDHPPPGFCSVTCREQRGQARPAEPPPPEPRVILRRMREHNRLIHNVDSALLAWGCEGCAELDAEYAESLEYHQARRTAELVKASGR
jgi:hypothetical protein